MLTASVETFASALTPELCPASAEPLARALTPELCPASAGAADALGTAAFLFVEQGRGDREQEFSGSSGFRDSNLMAIFFRGQRLRKVSIIKQPSFLLKIKIKKVNKNCLIHFGKHDH